MKKNLLILILVMVSFLAMGQSEFKQGGKFGENGTVIDSIKVESDVVNIYTGAILFPTANKDSTDALRVDSEANRVTGVVNADTSGVLRVDLEENRVTGADNTDTLTNHGIKIESTITKDINQSDSTINAYGQLSYLTNLIATLFDSINNLRQDIGGGDDTPPTFASGIVYSENPGWWLISFSEELTTISNDDDSIIAATGLTINGSPASIDSIDISNSLVTYYTADVSGGDVLKMSYDTPVSGGIRDVSGNDLVSFADTSVRIVNNSVYLIDYLAWFRFNGDLTEEKGGATGTPVNDIAYEGDSCLIFAGSSGEDAVHIGTRAITGDFSVSYRIYLDEDANEVYYSWSNNIGGDTEGIGSLFDGDGSADFRSFVRAGNGAASSWAEGVNGDLEPDGWYDIAEVYDVVGNGTDAYVDLYVDGVLANAGNRDFSSQSPLTTDQAMFIGSLATPALGLREGAKIDEFRIYNYALTTALIDSLDTNPFRLPYATTPSTPSSDDTLYFDIITEDFSDNVLGLYTKSAASADFGDLEGSNTDKSEILIVDNDTAMRFHCYSGENSGEGWSVRIPTDTITELWESYDIKFKTGFLVNAGCKLPGTGGRGANGESVPTGGATVGTNDGFSNRNATHSDGRLRQYVYHHLITSYGWNYYLDYTPSYTDDWFNYTVRMVLNSGTSTADGILEAFIDGVCVMSYDNILWREHLGVNIDYLMFSLYFGGSGSAQAALQDEYVDFDNFFIYQFQTDVPGSAGYPDLKSRYNTHNLGDKIPYRVGR